MMGEALGADSVEAGVDTALPESGGLLHGVASKRLAPDPLEGSTLGPGGRYKILQVIGDGGFGTVYMAEQTAPVRRRVAVKVLKAGMDTRQVVARFEAERQALAMMDHPNIAKVLDGGETDQGRLFFVMELVRGTPITAYCDREQLDTKARLTLFTQVCEAVQHAHQKGIIHRDLKPSNILVTAPDGAEPVPKVIDFGVAKALESNLTDKTLFTRFEQMIGTPAYMSPEQAGTEGGIDVDTRADIYALGVLLYELLTGTTPFDSRTLQQAAFEEVRRILREDDAPRPSARLGSLELGRRTTIAKERGTEAAGLNKLLRGDLDWIVMKALEKDRRRRYETANALALDVERHLADEPVSATPPTAAYRTGKFLRRHKAPLAVAATVFLLLVAGIGATSWQALRATAEKDRAVEAEELAEERRKEAEAISDFITGMFESAKPESEEGGRSITVEEALRIAEEKLEDDAEMPPGRRAVLQKSIAEVYVSLGRHAEGAEVLEKAVASYRAAHGADHIDTFRAMHSLAHAYAAAGAHEKAIRLFEDAVVLGAETLGLDHPDVQKWLSSLSRNSRFGDGLEKVDRILSTEGGDFIDSTQRPSETLLNPARERVLQVLRENYERARTTNGPQHPDTIVAMGLSKAAYFRHRFTTEKPFDNLELRCQRDAGIVVYLDGQEVGRGNMVEGEERFELAAESIVGDAAEATAFRLPLEGVILEPGDHVLAISLHNHGEPSSDLRIGEITLVEVEEESE